MPSQSRLNFERFLLRDVQQLRDLHREQFRGPGRPHSFLTRSGIFLLCAAWELYSEDVIRESFLFVLDQCDEPLRLPEQVRRTLANGIKSEKNELAPLRLAGEGWKVFLREHTELRIAQLNTPNSDNLIDLFRRFVGIDMSPTLQPHNVRLTEFISKRGDIAHKGAEAGHISIANLEADYAFICGLVTEVDNGIIDPVRLLTAHRPWNRRN
jgi:hypothetical protein